MNKKITISGEEQTRLGSLSDAEKRRYDRIVQIQDYLAQGYSSKDICELMQIGCKQVRRYATGDPLLMCNRKLGGRASKLDKYQEDIISQLNQNIQMKDIYNQIESIEHTVHISVFCKYCNKLIKEYDIDYISKKNPAGVKIKI